jgi:hypothetical protein
MAFSLLQFRIEFKMNEISEAVKPAFNFLKAKKIISVAIAMAAHLGCSHI